MTAARANADRARRLQRPAAQAGLQDALPSKAETERRCRRARAYDDLTLRLRSSTSSACATGAQPRPAARAHHRVAAGGQAAQLGGAQYLEQLQAAEVDLTQLAARIEQDGVKLHGLQTEIDRINREIAALAPSTWRRSTN